MKTIVLAIEYIGYFVVRPDESFLKGVTHLYVPVIPQQKLLPPIINY